MSATSLSSILNPIGINAAVICGEILLERVSLFVLVRLPGGFFRVSYCRVFGSGSI